MFGPGLLAVITASASVVLGEAAWKAGQVSTRICQWQQLRAAVLRDTVYLDGGALWWQPGFADGSVKEPVSDNNRLGHIYTLNFTTPFNTTQNISAVFDILETGGGDTNNRAPNYEDGALLYNNEQFFLYGGLLQRTSTADDPAEDTVLSYEKYPQGPSLAFDPGFINKPLGENNTRYIAYGGAASAPSENLAWYFSGLRSPTWGPIYTKAGATEETAATNVSHRLITLEMAERRDETFANDTLKSDVRGRANPELVWVPVGERGILVALGGVVFPDFVPVVGRSTDEEASKEESPEFMSTIDIYDVDSKKWYRQKTTGGPGQLTRGCAVVARAQDGSSFNIYYYGGYDGLTQASEPFSDDVWVLSLPSFTWTQLTQSTAEGRAGHKCVTPYPDQMFAIGGYPSPKGRRVPECLEETIRVLNLSTGEWLDRYDPAVHADYVVPSAVVDKIGGSGTGGATAMTPSPSWDASELADIFDTEYPMSKITTYYPYASVAVDDNTNPNAPPPSVEDDDGGGLPAYLPPVLGVVLGLVFLTMVAVLILLYRRRRILRGGTMSEAGTEDTAGHRITSWLRGQPSEVKTPTMTSSTDYLPVSSTDADKAFAAPQQRTIAEMMNTEVQMPAELPDTSPPAELQSTTDPSSATATSHPASLNNPHLYPATHQTDHANTPSPIPTPSPQPHPSPPPIPGDTESPIFYRPDSEALGRNQSQSTATTSPTATTTANASPVGTTREHKVLSGISNLSERDRAHLRQISDTTVSSVTTAPVGYSHTGADRGDREGGRERMMSGVSALSGTTGPGNLGGYVGDRGGGGGGGHVMESPAVVSPPTATAGPGEGVDYLGARSWQGQAQAQAQAQQGSASPLRRSVFSEDINGSHSGAPPGSGGGEGGDGRRGG